MRQGSGSGWAQWPGLTSKHRHCHGRNPETARCGQMTSLPHPFPAPDWPVSSTPENWDNPGLAFTIRQRVAQTQHVVHLDHLLPVTWQSPTGLPPGPPACCPGTESSVTIYLSIQGPGHARDSTGKTQ